MIKNDFPEHVAKVFQERLKELGMSRYRFIRSFPVTNQGTLERILTGVGSTNIQTLAYYADCLGLEVIIRKKEENRKDNK